MHDDDWKFGLTILAVVGGLAALIFACSYFEGVHKSDYLRDQEGMTVPWQQAMYVDITIRRESRENQDQKDME